MVLPKIVFLIFEYNGISDLKAHLDNLYHHARSCENQNFCSNSHQNRSTDREASVLAFKSEMPLEI